MNTEYSSLILLILSFSKIGISFRLTKDEERPPLYNSLTDSISLFNVSNIEAALTDSKATWLIEFYSSWCGHCIQFAPSFKTLASSVRFWSPLLKVGALDCSEENNIETCRNYEIMGYPTLKFFPPHSSRGSLGVKREGASNDIEVIRRDMVEFVEKNYKAYSFPLPILESMTEDEVRVLRNQKSSSMILLAEKDAESTPLSKEILLGTSNLPIPIRRISFSKSGDYESFVFSFGGNGNNNRSFSILYFNSQENAKTNNPVFLPLPQNISSLSLTETLRSFFHIKEKISFSPLSETETSIKQFSSIIPSKKDILRRRYTVSMTDLEKAVMYSLRNEIGGRTFIHGDELRALVNYLRTLYYYFPTQDSSVKDVFAILLDWISGHSGGIHGKDLFERFIIRENVDWSSCKGSSPQFGGYTCGLWSTFHALTVNYALLSDLEGNPKMDILSVIADYMKYFFGCRDCSSHFALMFKRDSPPKSSNSPNESILWLWKAHNKVNIRLSGALSDDPIFPKAPFPSKDNCLSCYNGKDFSEPHVLIFLKKFYGVNSIVASFPISLLSKNLRPTPSFFSRTDIQLWALFYSFSALFLIITVYSFTCRRRSCSKILFQKSLNRLRISLA